ncbi:HTR-like protein (plasmid) [Haloarcula marismortui ATCC 43049]|uniref:AI-2E family transporter n=2 Tax=Haloarcula marismortui TaxID=2238 RepID=Q5V7M0_HALMA|nr:AI-2E family transporter [Haloarcula marismortui]AAV44483.1 HTR-like protein [Haloarcula marismortui ATCC 43049]QCP89663.1 AI-2E family transporter [Haloarcula marismortui ATCC 43049]
MKRSTRFQQRSLFAIGGLGLLIGVAFVLVQFRATLIFTVFLYYASRPIYRKLESVSTPSYFSEYSLPYRRQILAVTTISVFLLPFLLLFTYTLALVVPAVQQFIGQNDLASGYLSAIQSADSGGLPEPIAGLQISDLLDMSPEEIVTILNAPSVRTWIEQTLGTLISSIGVFADVGIQAFLLLSGTYYLLTDGPRLSRWLFDHFDESGVVESYAIAVDDELSSILFGNILNALVTGIIGIVVFSAYNSISPAAVQVPFAPLVGALTGAGSLIPVVGMKIVYFPVGAILTVGAVASGQATAIGYVLLFLILAFVVVDTIPDFLIRPYVSGNRTHVGLLMFAYILGPIVFGAYGIFLGPILLVLVAQFFRTVAPYVATGEPPDQSKLYEY